MTKLEISWENGGEGGEGGGGGGSKMYESHFGKRGGKGADWRASGKEAVRSPQKEGGSCARAQAGSIHFQQVRFKCKGEGGDFQNLGGGGGSQYAKVMFKRETSGFLKNFTGRASIEQAFFPPYGRGLPGWLGRKGKRERERRKRRGQIFALACRLSTPFPPPPHTIHTTHTWAKLYWRPSGLNIAK